MSRNGIGLRIFMSLGLIAMATASAQADFMLLPGNNPQFDENVLLDRDSAGRQVVGSTNRTGTAVLFESLSQFLAATSSGQARIEAHATNDINAAQIAIDEDIMIALQDPVLGFRSLVVNSFIGGRLGAGGDLSFTVAGFDAGGSPISQTLGPEAIGNGSNFFTLVATSGEIMKSVTVIPGATTSYADLRQTRIGGIVPEPSTLVLLAMLLPLVAVGRISMQERR